MNASDDVPSTQTLPEAVASGDISESTARDVLGALSKMTLGQMLDSKLIDPNTGKYIHPETKRRMTIKEAIDQGFIQPSVVFFEDTANDRIASLQSFIDDGRFNPAYGKLLSISFTIPCFDRDTLELSPLGNHRHLILYKTSLMLNVCPVEVLSDEISLHFRFERKVLFT